MAVQRFTLPLFISPAGIMLFLSWYLPVDHGWWAIPDHAIFRFFNDPLAGNHSLAIFIAVINNRAFDLAALLLMGLIYYAAFRKQDSAGQRRLVMAGIVMVISAVLINQAGQAIPFNRLSPTLELDSVHRISDITGIFTKDASKSSFPGDHGLMLMIFAAFVWRYAGFYYFIAAILLIVIFSLPRIMAGAHWFSDILAGSLSLTLITLPWILLTPLSDRCVNFLIRCMPRLSDITKKISH
ncbi:phosphatase PAP2 family protein [Morganella morganii]|nr:phosphatase PAP2 family protein [Morganella morganii]